MTDETGQLAASTNPNSVYKKVEEEGALSKCWDNLVDHTKELLEASRDVLIAQYNELGAVLKKADMPSMETFVNIYGKILVNAFSLRSDR